MKLSGSAKHLTQALAKRLDQLNEEHGFPRQVVGNIYCRPLVVEYSAQSVCTGEPGHSENAYGICRICAQRKVAATEPAWVTALKTQLARVTEERDHWRERAESCSGAVERLATTLRTERAAHHD